MSNHKSKRAVRVERRHKRNSKVATLSLTSLMDIFTILVFFLLVNSSQQQPPTNKDLTLPLSTASKAMKQNLIVMVTSDSIIVQGIKVADVAEASKLEDDSIPDLLAELKRQSASLRESTSDPIKLSEITIMGHQEIPYKLLRKLMFTCTESDFTRISLAVMKKNEGGNTNE